MGSSVFVRAKGKNAITFASKKQRQGTIPSGRLANMHRLARTGPGHHDLGIGDIFNCRVAGNVSNADILGSMEFAGKLAGAKVALVMGHTASGAIKGAIDNAELGNLTGLLAKIRPAIEATAYSGERSAKNYAFVDAVVRKNVEMTVAEIRSESRVPCLLKWKRKGRSKWPARCTTWKRAL